MFIISRMKKGLASRTALKFERYQIERTEQNMSATYTTFRTHTISQSDVYHEIFRQKYYCHKTLTSPTKIKISFS